MKVQFLAPITGVPSNEVISKRHHISDKIYPRENFEPGSEFEIRNSITQIISLYLLINLI
jgi:hypothetical protein